MPGRETASTSQLTLCRGLTQEGSYKDAKEDEEEEEEEEKRKALEGGSPTVKRMALAE